MEENTPAALNNKPLEDRLKSAALAYLQKRPASESRLTKVLAEKMKRWATPEENVPLSLAYIRETLIPWLKSHKLLDDTAYRQALIASYRRKGLSSQAIRLKSQRFGVDLSAPEGDELCALLRRLKRKRQACFAEVPPDSNQRQKLRTSLMRLGFSLALIEECLALSQAQALELLAQDPFGI